MTRTRRFDHWLEECQASEVSDKPSGLVEQALTVGPHLQSAMSSDLTRRETQTHIALVPYWTLKGLKGQAAQLVVTEGRGRCVVHGSILFFKYMLTGIPHIGSLQAQWAGQTR